MTLMSDHDTNIRPPGGYLVIKSELPLLFYHALAVISYGNFLFSSLAELEPNEELAPRRVTRILTTEFPQYFAIVTRVRQESATVSPEGGMLSSTVVPQVQAVFPPGALTKKIKMGLQVSFW